MGERGRPPIWRPRSPLSTTITTRTVAVESWWITLRRRCRIAFYPRPTRGRAFKVWRRQPLAGDSGRSPRHAAGAEARHSGRKHDARARSPCRLQVARPRCRLWRQPQRSRSLHVASSSWPFAGRSPKSPGARSHLRSRHPKMRSQPASRSRAITLTSSSRCSLSQAGGRYRLGPPSLDAHAPLARKCSSSIQQSDRN